jgi:hypothetical protein
MPDGSIYFEVDTTSEEFISLADKTYERLAGFCTLSGSLQAYFCFDESEGTIDGFTYNLNLDLVNNTIEYDPTAGIQRLMYSEE